jgi:hypothetical protein
MKNPNAAVDDAVYNLFVASQEIRILANKAALWPRAKRLDHWSNLKMRRTPSGDYGYAASAIVLRDSPLNASWFMPTPAFIRAC